VNASYPPGSLWNVRLTDTDPDSRRRQFDAYRAMAPEGRVEIALSLSEDVKQIAMAGIRRRHPTMSEEEADRAWLRLLHGSELATYLAADSPHR